MNILETPVPAILEMTISPDLEQDFKGFPFFLEIEMLRGERQVQPDGRVRLVMEIEDPDKVDCLRQFILRLMSKPVRECSN